jgi:arylsulfatase A-like enzyme
MIREALDREGLADNTVIVFTSDNGYSCGAHGLGDKVLPYEEASKMPLVIYDPRLPKAYAGKVSDAVTANVDMCPTMLEWAGLPVPAEIDGKCLLPLLTNPAGKIRDYLPLFNFWGAASAQAMAVVTPEWKYIYWWYSSIDLKPVEELFPVGQDRFEMKNVAAATENAARLAAMRAIYDAELARLARGAVQDHFYEPYPVLFSRTASWQEKSRHLDTEDWRRRASATTTK